VSDAADVIADVIGQQAKHNDTDRNAWIEGTVAAGVPAAYGEMLRTLTETIASGHGSRPNNDAYNVTGRPPISFADFARRTAQAWAQKNRGRRSRVADDPQDDGARSAACRV
jgi:hypothetical protein